MKRIILLSALLLAASACTTTTQAPSNTNTSTPPANTSNSSTPNTGSTTLNSEITDKEKQIWDAIKKKDAAGFAAMLADDFIYISSDGVFDKAATANGVKQIEATEVTLSDWKTVMLDKDAAVVTYTVIMKGTSGGKPIPPGSMRASSAWVNRGGKWVGVYHQETEIAERPSTTPTTAKPTAETKGGKPAEAKPAASNPDEAINREQQVWDAIKKRDYVAFANFLADDQIQVMPNGLNDKVGSVNGVQKVDLSGASLSNFKVVKLDDDASLVTYMVKFPADISPNPERSSTIWVNRGGKWSVVFHQGTEVKPPAKK
jgi:hypothetical protein